MRMNIFLTAILAATTVAGCSPKASVEHDRTDIRGRITGVIPGADASRALQGFIQVDGTRQPDTQYDRAAITITDSTHISLGGDAGKDGTFGDLKMGDSVEATFTGPVRTSYPVQATASKVRIIAHP